MQAIHLLESLSSNFPVLKFEEALQQALKVQQPGRQAVSLRESPHGFGTTQTSRAREGARHDVVELMDTSDTWVILQSP